MGESHFRKPDSLTQNRGTGYSQKVLTGVLFIRRSGGKAHQGVEHLLLILLIENDVQSHLDITISGFQCLDADCLITYSHVPHLLQFPTPVSARST